MTENKQLLHLVMGGRVVDPQGVEFQDLNEIHIVGVFPNYAEAEDAWRAQMWRSFRSWNSTPCGSTTRPPITRCSNCFAIDNAFRPRELSRAP